MEALSRNWQKGALLGAGAAERRDESPAVFAHRLGSSGGGERRPWTHGGRWAFLLFHSVEVFGRAAGLPLGSSGFPSRAMASPSLCVLWAGAPAGAGSVGLGGGTHALLLLWGPMLHKHLFLATFCQLLTVFR